MTKPTLYIFSGLPGSGKSTLAHALSRVTGCCYLRVDTVEQGLRDLCAFNVEGEGYRLSYRIAADNLKLGIRMVADSCNPIELTRREWRDVAASSSANFINIEVVCSDESQHRCRVENRVSTVEGLKLPTWEEVIDREYDSWSEKRLVIDSASKSIDETIQELLVGLGIGEVV